jgi:uncharacterized protein
MDQLTLPFTAASFKQLLDEKKLMASRCKKCHTLHLPPRAICSECFSTDLDWAETSGSGKLAAFTAVHIGPSFMNENGYGRDNPYLTGIVELEEGLKISARILGVDPQAPEDIRIGSPVELQFTEEGQLGFKVVTDE